MVVARRPRVETSTGLSVAYLAAGPLAQGSPRPPLVLLHGLGADSAEWLLSLPMLARRRRVIAPDLIGHGRSAKPSGPGVRYRLRLLADAVLGALEALGVAGPIDLLGHSLGGAVALDLVRQHPRLVRRLVLVDAAWIPSADSLTPLSLSLPFVPGGFADSRRLLRTSVGSRLLNNDLVALAVGLYKGRASNRAELTKLVASIASGEDVVTARELSRLPQDTLVLWGANDRIFPVDTGRRLVSHLRRSRLEILPRCSHVPPTERPVAFARRVLEFLDA